MQRAILAATAILFSTTPNAVAQNDLPPPPQTAGIAIPDGQIEKAVAQLDTIVNKTMEQTGIPGIAVAVVNESGPLLVKGYGTRNAGEEGAVDADTVFQLASLSKPVGATVVAAAVDRGIVNWNSRMAELLPWFQLSDPKVTDMLTIGDLYAHRSGLPDHAGDDLEDLGFDQRTILERLRFLDLSEFRTSYAYTNFGLTAAAEAVAAASGKDWASLSEELLYRPAGMTHTSSRLSDFLDQNNRAYGHVRDDGTWQALYQRKPDAQSPAGGVSASAADMGRWMQIVLGSGTMGETALMGKDALLPAISPQVISSHPYAADARAGFYGYGFGVGTSPAGRVMLSHSGAFALGAATNVVMLPSAGIGIVVLSNAQPVGAVEAIGMSFMDLVQFGTVRRDWLTMYGSLMKPLLAPFGEFVGKEPPISPKPARNASVYSGAYANDYFGVLDISETPEGLSMAVTGSPSTFALTHWNGNTFVFYPHSENATEGSVSAVRFTVEDNSDKADQITVELFNEEKMGVFLRRD